MLISCCHSYAQIICHYQQWWFKFHTKFKLLVTFNQCNTCMYTHVYPHTLRDFPIEQCSTTLLLKVFDVVDKLIKYALMLVLKWPFYHSYFLFWGKLCTLILIYTHVYPLPMHTCVHSLYHVYSHRPTYTHVHRCTVHPCIFYDKNSHCIFHNTNLYRTARKFRGQLIFVDFVDLSIHENFFPFILFTCIDSNWLTFISMNIYSQESIISMKPWNLTPRKFLALR